MSHEVTIRQRTLRWVGAVAATVALAASCSPGQPEHARITIGTGPVEFHVELAQTANQQRDGLSGREAVPEGTGMLFQFGSRAEQQVWMAGATIPLDVAWIVDGEVLAVDTLPPCTEDDQDRCPVWTSPGPVDSLLEVSAKSLVAVVPGMGVTLEEQPS